MDLSWSNDSNHLVSGSLDGSAILWSINQNKFNKIQTFEGHKKFVQGVAVHPTLKYVATASSDATVRIYKNRKLKSQQQFFHKFTIKSREQEISEGENKSALKEIIQNDQQDQIMVDQENNPKEILQANQPSDQSKKRTHRLFLDDTEYQSFVRRLSFSPDGSFMLTPGSWYQDLNSQSVIPGLPGTTEKF